MSLQIQIISDTHLSPSAHLTGDCPIGSLIDIHPNTDVVVVAGDVADGTNALTFLKMFAKNNPHIVVVAVKGNHCYYSTDSLSAAEQYTIMSDVNCGVLTVDAAIAKSSKILTDRRKKNALVINSKPSTKQYSENLFLLDRASITIKGVEIFGMTGWASGENLMYPQNHTNPFLQLMNWQRMNDSRYIYKKSAGQVSNIEMVDYATLHKRDAAALQRFLDNPTGSRDPALVVMHYAPSWQSMGYEFYKNPRWAADQFSNMSADELAKDQSYCYLRNLAERTSNSSAYASLVELGHPDIGSEGLIKLALGNFHSSGYYLNNFDAMFEKSTRRGVIVHGHTHCPMEYDLATNWCCFSNPVGFRNEQSYDLYQKHRGQNMIITI